MFERSIQRKITCTGVGVHSGKDVTLTLLPATEGFGIQFKRTDISDKQNIIPALWSNVDGTRFSTAITNEDQVSVSTIEHLMAALSSYKITNLLIEVSGAEVPILDGSAIPFMQLIQKAGIKTQSKRKKYLHILKKISVEHKDTWAILEPNHTSNTFALTYEFKLRTEENFQIYSTPNVIESFAKDLACARTFGFLEDASNLRQAGLAQGASLENTVVFDGNHLLNEGGLRFEDECLRHKVLDAVGDLYLVGLPIIGRFYGHLSGHTLNNRLLKSLFADEAAWEIASSPSTVSTYQVTSYTNLSAASA